MASLFGRSPKDSYKELLTINDNGGLGAALHELGDGKGGISPLSLSLTQISLNGVTWPTTAIQGAYLRVGASNQLEWASLTTSDVSEGSNLYFTVSRGRALFTGVGDISVNPDTGEISYTGAGGVGAQGPQGEAGPQGPVGPQGAVGPAGQDGAPGPQGPQGEKGDTGATGPAGPAGQDGAPGAQGLAGVDGQQGPQGVPGNDGAQGPAGNDGAPGAAGRDGVDGAMGPQGLTGPAGADGAPGPKGDTGEQGPIGPQGPQGPQGEVGPAGTTTGSSDQDFAAKVLTAVDGNFSGNVNVGGNIYVAGQALEVQSSNTTTSNTTLILNDGEIGNGVTAGVSGLLVDRGTASQGRLVFDEAAGGWKVGTAASSGLIATQPWVTANTVPTTHIGAGGSVHATATSTNAGFMSSADKVKLDGMVSGISQTAADARYLQLSGGTVTGTLTVSTPIQGNISGTASNVTGVVGLANGGTGVNATSAAQLVTALGAATLASPTFTGVPKAPTASASDNSTQIATTAWVQGQSYLKTTGTVANATNASTAASVPWSGVTNKPTTLAGYGITDKIATVSATVNQVPYSNGSAYIGSPEFTFTTGVGAGPGGGYSTNTLNIGTAGGLNVNINLGGSSMGQFGMATSSTISTGQTLALNAIRNDGTGSVNLRVGGVDKFVVTNTGSSVTGTLNVTGVLTAGSFTGAGTGLTGTAANLTAGSATAVPWANITSKPTTFAGYGITTGSLTGLTVTNTITGSVSGSAGSVAWANIQNRPTTLAGYGITDASSTSATQPISRGGTGATTAPDALVNLGAAPLASPGLTGVPTAPTAAAATSTNQIATTAYVKSQNYIAAPSASQAPQYNIPFYDGNGKLMQTTNFNFTGGASGAGPGGNWSPSTLNIGAASGYAATINLYSSYSQSAINTNSSLIINADGSWTQLRYQSTVMAQVDNTGLKVPNGNLTVTNNITASGTITATGGFTGNFTGTVNGNITGTAAGLSVTLPINKGGTGATTAAAALQALNGLPLTGGSLTGALTVAGTVTALTGANGGFQNASYAGGRNNIWRFADSPSYGLSYFQGAGGKNGTDSIGIHFGNPTATGSTFSFNSSDGSFDAARFNGAGTGLTGTAASLSIGGNAATATSASKLTTARTIAGVSFDGTANISIPVANITGAAALASPAFTGTPTAPTATAGTNTTQIATTAFVAAAVASAGGAVSSVAGRTGAVVLAQADISGLTTSSSPSFTALNTTGKVIAGTGLQSIGLSNTRNPIWSMSNNDGVGISHFQGTASSQPGVADTVGIHFTTPSAAGSVHQFNQDGTAKHSGALTASNFIGAGTGLTGTASSLSIGGTAANVTGTVAIANGGTGATTASAALTALGAAPLASPALTGVPTAPTATAGTNTTQIATTAFVTAAVASGGGAVSSVAGKTGAVTLTQADISGLTTSSSPTFNAVTSTTSVSAGNDATTGGFFTSTFAGNARNPIWRFGNSPNYGFSYYQGTAGKNGAMDTLGFHFGTTTLAGTTFRINQDGTAESTGAFTAASFVGAGTGLTGTAAGLSIGGNAATATTVSGTIAVANGGTGATSLTGLVYGNGTSAMTAATAAQIVSAIGTTAVTNATNATNVSGTVAIANGGTGATTAAAAVVALGIPYDLASAIIGKPAAGATVLRFVAVRAFSIPSALAGSRATSAVAATGSTALTLYKNGTSFGTMTWAASSTTATMAAASATSFAIGDVLTIVAPATQDSTFADAQYTIIANLV